MPTEHRSPLALPNEPSEASAPPHLGCSIVAVVAEAEWDDYTQEVGKEIDHRRHAGESKGISGDEEARKGVQPNRMFFGGICGRGSREIGVR